MKEGGPPPARTTDPALLVVDERWGARIAELVEPPSRAALSSSQGEYHPPALTEPYVTVSRHTALAGRSLACTMRCQ